MLKKEVIWREILFQAIEKNNYNFQQKELANKFSFSLSTVFNAIKEPREINAVKVSGRGFKLISAEKLLYLWGTKRKFKKDIVYKTYVNQQIAKIEASMPSKVIWSSFSAYKYKFKDVPADYGRVCIYANNWKEIKKRFSPKRGPSNLFVLKPDDYLKRYGVYGTLGQIFVDIWNSEEWYAAEFIKKLKTRINIW